MIGAYMDARKDALFRTVGLFHVTVVISCNALTGVIIDTKRLLVTEISWFSHVLLPSGSALAEQGRVLARSEHRCAFGARIGRKGRSRRSDSRRRAPCPVCIARSCRPVLGRGRLLRSL